MNSWISVQKNGYNLQSQLYFVNIFCKLPTKKLTLTGVKRKSLFSVLTKANVIWWKRLSTFCPVIASEIHPYHLFVLIGRPNQLNLISLLMNQNAETSIGFLFKIHILQASTFWHTKVDLNDSLLKFND